MFGLRIASRSSAVCVPRWHSAVIPLRSFAEEGDGSSTGLTGLSDLLQKLRLEQQSRNEEGKKKSNAPETPRSSIEVPQSSVSFSKDDKSTTTSSTEIDFSKLWDGLLQDTSPTQTKEVQLEPEGPKKLALEDLKYFKYYPPLMRRWIIDCKTPRGFFNSQGVWTPRGEERVAQIVKQWREEPDRAEKRRVLKDKKLLPLPLELKDRYRFGVTEEDLEAVDAPDDIRELLSYSHAKDKEKNRGLIEVYREKYGRHIADTGSSEVQIAIMTMRIRYLSELLKGSHNKNFKMKRYVQILVDRRRQLMRYLKKDKPEAYVKVLAGMNLRDMVLTKINRKAYK